MPSSYLLVRVAIGVRTDCVRVRHALRVGRTLGAAFGGGVYRPLSVVALFHHPYPSSTECRVYCSVSAAVGEAVGETDGLVVGLVVGSGLSS